MMSFCMSSPTGPRVGLRVTFLRLFFVMRGYARKIAYPRVTKIVEKNVMLGPTLGPVGEDMQKLTMSKQSG